MYELTKNDLRFLKSFNENMGQYELNEEQFTAYLNDDDDAVPIDTLSALADAYCLWHDAVEGVNHVSN